MRNTIKMIKVMRSITLAALVAVIGFEVASCATTGTTTSTSSNVPATLTITGLKAYNGLRIAAETWDDIFAAADIVDFVEPMSRASIGLGGVISNGSVTLPVWETDTSTVLNREKDVFEVAKKRYTGSGPLDFLVTIWEGTEVFYMGYSVARGNLTVTFKNGKAETALVVTPTPKDDD
jgi:hypothetical protein